MSRTERDATRRGYRKPTIHDVAAQARVSITTVSHFVSGRHGTCSPETAERIQQAITHLHYTPNSISRSLSQGKTQVVGVSMASPSHDESPFTDRVWRGINTEADERDYALLHYPASLRDSTNHRLFLDGRVDGLILSTFHSDLRPANLAAAGMPTVLLTRSFDLPEGCGTVYADERDVVDLALSHLWNTGHRRIAHLVGPAVDPDESHSPIPERSADSAVLRQQEFTSWLEARGVMQPLVSAPNMGWHPIHVRETMEQWYRLSEPPTAIFCANDEIAVAALEHARLLKWRVPDELSVIGVDNSIAGAASVPSLTTVEVDGEMIGKEALRCLLRLMAGAPAMECCVAVSNSRLIERASTAPVSDRMG